MNKILSINNLSKKYDDKVAVSNLSFDIEENQIIGLLGPNGVGKTTTINMILGVLEPSSGNIKISGYDLKSERTKALNQINFAAVYAPLPGNLTVYQNLKIFGVLYSVINLDEMIEYVLEKFNILKFKNTPTGLLSSGEQTRVCIAKAMINKPKLLLLDEPTASLDPATAQDIREIIVDFSKSVNTAVLWTSHNMNEVSDVCNKVIFLYDGKILLQGDPKTLPKENGEEDLEQLFIKIAKKGTNES